MIIEVRGQRKSSYGLGYGIVQPSLNPNANRAPLGSRQPSRNALETENTEVHIASLQPSDIVTIAQLIKVGVYLVEEEYLVTALVPSDTACLASSPGRINRTLSIVNSWTPNENQRRLTMSESHGRKLSTSCCKLLASTLQWPHARRYLDDRLDVLMQDSDLDWHTVNKRVQNGHGTVRDSSIWMDLLQDCRRRVSRV